MPFETLKASIYSLLEEIAGQPQDRHALHERLREHMQELRAMGQPIPEDLQALEDWLEDELEQPGRRPPPLPHDLRGRGRSHADRQPERRHPRPHSEED